MRVWALKRDEVSPDLLDLASAQSVALFGEHDDRAPFGRLVGQARQLRGVC